MATAKPLLRAALIVTAGVAALGFSAGAAYATDDKSRPMEIDSEIDSHFSDMESMFHNSDINIFSGTAVSSYFGQD